MSRRHRKVKAPNPWALLTEKQIQHRADLRTKALLQPQQDVAGRNTKAALAEIAGAGAAAAKMLQESRGATQKAYSNAAQELAGLGQGFSGGMRDVLAQQQGQSDQYAQLQGQDATPNPIDATKASDALYGRTYNESANLISQGASANALRGTEIASNLAQTRQSLASRQALGDQQLLDLAAKRPELRQQVLDELYKREMDKLDLRIKQQAQNMYAQQFGVKTAQENTRLAQSGARIGLEARREKAYEKSLRTSMRQHQAAIDAAKSAGRQPDSSLSRVYGHIVDAHGRPILDNGKKIRVSTHGAGHGSKGLTPSEQHSNIRQAGAEAERMWRQHRSTGSVDLATGKRTPPEHPWHFHSAQRFLISSYGISRSQARRLLVSAGFRAPGRAMHRRRRGSPGRHRHGRPT